MLMLAAIGCGSSNYGDKRIAEMAQQQLQRQEEQNRRLAEMHREVAEGARRLVEADAAAREEMIGLHREVQAERSEIGKQRDVLEQDRRDLAAKRRMDPIIAAAITDTGLLLACLLPLVVCLFLLHPRVEPADDQAVAELLLDRSDLALGHGRWMAAANEAADFWRVFDEMPGLIVEIHLDEDVARIEGARAHAGLAAAALLHVLLRDQDVPEAAFHAGLLDALLEGELHFVFVARVGLNDIPLHGVHTS